MRTFDILAVGVAITLCSTKMVAENQTPAAPTPPTTAEVLEVKVLAPDHLVMSAGSILVVRGTQTSRLESELRLTDGSILTPGGTVKRPDGSTTRLADRQAISPAGKVGTAPAGAVTDSTATPTAAGTVIQP